MYRKLTEPEKMMLHESILMHLNEIADCEGRKACFVSEINREIKAHQLEVDVARKQLNDDCVEEVAQTELPLEG